jgi:peroxiredoxin
LRITNQNYITLILDSNENVKITGDAQSLGNTYNVTGSEDSKLFWVFNTFSKNNFYSRDSLTHLFNNLINSYKGSAERMDSLQNAFEKPYNTLVHEQNTFVKNFVSSHPKSFSSLAAVQQLSPDSQVHWYIKLDSALSKNYPKSVYIKHFHTKTESMKRVAIGAIAPDITLQDTNGYELSLNKMEEHNYLFIDFWASWCPACIESMPGLVKVYNTFRDKNFTIVGVSLDSKKDNWTSAIRKYHLIWTQVSDLKSWDSKVVALYNLSELPYSVLVSPKGKIIAKNIDPEQLNQMLDTLSLQSIINKPL